MVLFVLDLQNDRPFTPEPTGIMSPGDISVSNLVTTSPVLNLDSSGISEVAKANEKNDEDDSSSDDDEDDNDEDAAAGIASN